MPMTTTQLVAQPADYERANLLRFTRKQQDLEAAIVAYKRAQQRRRLILFWAGVVAVAIGGVIVWGMR